MYANKPPSFFQTPVTSNTVSASLGATMYSEKDFQEITSHIDPNTPQPKLYLQKCNEIGTDLEVDNTSEKLLCGVQESSLFSKLFFSKENVSEIQRVVKYQVYVKSGNRHIISRQTPTELLIVMRSIFLQYSQIPESVNCYKKEIARLNSLVVGSVLPGILDGIEQYIGYLKDSSRLPEPMDLPKVPTGSGNKDLRSSTDVLFGDAQFFESK
jgi:hypothetical protein